MKKFIATALVIILVFSFLTACGDNNNAAITEGTYNISDYYNGDGRFSELGETLPLDPETGENVLTLKSGDIIILGDLKYAVTEESLKLYFYTQPSLDEVFEWWADYFRVWEENGIVIAVQ